MNYSDYTLKELEEAYHSINKQKYPKRFENIETEIGLRKKELELEPSSNNESINTKNNWLKKAVVFIGVFFIGIILFFAGIHLITSLVSPDEKKTFIPFINETIPKLTTWDYGEYEKIVSPEAFHSYTKEQWNNYLKSISKLGSLKSIGKPQPGNSTTMLTIRKGALTTSEYTVPITFDTGLAHVWLKLNYKKDEIEIIGIKFLSDLLTE